MITYAITVTNTGNEALDDVTVKDTVLGDISAAFPARSRSVGSRALIDYMVHRADPDPLVNVVTASGLGADSG